MATTETNLHFVQFLFQLLSSKERAEDKHVTPGTTRNRNGNLEQESFLEQRAADEVVIDAKEVSSSSCVIESKAWKGMSTRYLKLEPLNTRVVPTAF